MVIDGDNDDDVAMNSKAHEALRVDLTINGHCMSRSIDRSVSIPTATTAHRCCVPAEHPGIVVTVAHTPFVLDLMSPRFFV
jgi:hypothetical protein